MPAPKVKILVVEDEAPKQTHIVRFLESLATGTHVVVARSVNSAIDAIEANCPHLILLDMSLPTFDIGDGESGGRPQGFGGVEVLRHMVLAEIKCPVIVVTGYEAFPREGGKPVDLTEMRMELEQEFPSLFCGLLHFNSTFDEWKQTLRKLLAEFGIVGDFS